MTMKTSGRPKTCEGVDKAVWSGGRKSPSRCSVDAEVVADILDDTMTEPMMRAAEDFFGVLLGVDEVAMISLIEMALTSSGASGSCRKRCGDGCDLGGQRPFPMRRGATTA
jgi:hypothetical protein